MNPPRKPGEDEDEEVDEDLKHLNLDDVVDKFDGGVGGGGGGGSVRQREDEDMTHLIEKLKEEKGNRENGNVREKKVETDKKTKCADR